MDEQFLPNFFASLFDKFSNIIPLQAHPAPRTNCFDVLQIFSGFLF